MYNDSKRKVRLSRLSMGEGDSHSHTLTELRYRNL
jgi:hypothetical protein